MFSSTRTQSGKRVLYSREKNPRMPEKRGFAGAFIHLRFI
jgi:hypothetical protein